MLKSLILLINNIIWGLPLITMLTFTGIYLTIKYRFPQRRILKAFKDMFNRESKAENKVNKKRITSFKLLMTILAGTLGVGNITGVASAICIGGVGSIFWMFVSGVISMATSYVENYIVLSNRKYNKKTGYYGGTMYVLEEVVGNRKMAVLFSIFLVCATIGMGAMVQANSLSTIASVNFNIDKKIIGVLLALISAYIIFGGKFRIAKLSSILVPICSMTYILLCFYICYMNKNMIIPGIINVVKEAFGIREVMGGIVGVSVIKVIGTGFCRGMFSNEAGMGSAPIFSATVDENDIELQARVASLSVVIDTLIVCMITGITIISTGAYNTHDIQSVINKVFGMVPYGNIIVTVCLMIFVIATIPCWEYYGEQGIRYLFNSNISTYIMRILYPLMIYVGCIMVQNIAWDLSSIANAAMTIPNMYMIYKLVN